MARLLRFAGYGLATSFVVAALIGFVASGGFSHFIGRPITAEQKLNAPHRVPERTGRRAGGVSEAAVSAGKRGSRVVRAGARRSGGAAPVAFGGTASAVGGLLAAIWRIVRVALLVATVAIASYVGYRLLLVRPRRRTARFEVIPYEGDIGRSGSITDTWDELVEALQPRYWERVARGVETIALELHNRRDPETGALRIALAIVVPDEQRMIDHVSSALRSTYENLRLERLEGEDARPASIANPVRLKRSRSFVKARLPTPVIASDGEEAQSEFAIDRLKAAMEEMAVPATFSLAVWPSPASYERLGIGWLRAHERSEGDGSGSSSVSDEEIAGAAQGIAHRPLAFADIRIAADERRVAKQLARAYRGSTRRGEARFALRFVRLRSRLYARRIERGLGNPLPSFARGVYSTAELAGLWRLPNQFRNAARVEAHPMPRLRPPAAMRRVDDDEGMVLTEPGLGEGARRGLWLWPEDLESNMAVLGTIGAGKTTALCRAFRNLTRPAPENANRMAVYVTPKGEDLERVLDSLETDKPVYVVDCLHPEIGFSPLRSSLPTAKKVEAVLEGMREMYRQADGDTQMYAATLAALQTYTVAIIELLRGPTFHDLADPLSSTPRGERARGWLMSALRERPDLGYLHGEVEELVYQLKKAEGAFVQRIAAPRNKITRMRADPMARVLHHPLQLDLRRLMEERAVLVVCGQQGALGTEAMKGLLTIFLVMLLSTVLTQQELPEEERTEVTLVLDEAHFFLGNEYLKTAMATARSAGFASILALQHLGQLARGDNLRLLTSLIGSWLFFRMADEDAADVANLLQPIHFASFMPTDSMLERRAVDPHALLSARKRWAMGRFIVHGEPSPAFTAVVEREPHVVGRGERYLTRMREHGARLASYEDLEIPMRPWLDGAASPTSAAAERSTLAVQPTRRRGEADRGEQMMLAPDKAAAARAAPAPPAAPSAADKGTPAPGRWRIARAARVAMPTELGPPPAALSRLKRYRRVSGIDYKESPPAPSPRPRRDGSKTWTVVAGEPQPSTVQLDVMRWLWEFGFMAQFQIEERLGRAKRTVQRLMGELHRLGLVERFVLTTKTDGVDPSLYRLTRAGFELLKLSAGRHGTYLDPAEEWQEDRTVVARQVGQPLGETEWEAQKKRKAVGMPHDIEVISWALQFERLLAPCLRKVWKRKAWQYPPADRVRVGGEQRWVVRGVADLPAPEGFFANLDFDFEAVRPDVAFEVDVDGDDGEHHIDILVEYERSGVRHEKLRDKGRSADAMRTAWAPIKPRYRELGEPPEFLYVLPDLDMARRAAEILDPVICGAIGRPSIPAHRWRYPGRASMFFTAAPLAYHRIPLAYSLPELPPPVRERLAPNASAARAALAASAGPVVEYPLGRALERPRGLTP
jgi:hypothetical protein